MIQSSIIDPLDELGNPQGNESKSNSPCDDHHNAPQPGRKPVAFGDKREQTRDRHDEEPQKYEQRQNKRATELGKKPAVPKPRGLPINCWRTQEGTEPLRAEKTNSSLFGRR